MKCQTIEQLTRISDAGAAKMNNGNYAFQTFPMSQTAGRVVKEDGTAYRVNTTSNTCSCPFYGDNQHFGRTAATCKHLRFAAAEIVMQKRIDEEAAREEARFAAVSEWEAENL